jgi:hypothetical protein
MPKIMTREMIKIEGRIEIILQNNYPNWNMKSLIIEHFVHQKE